MSIETYRFKIGAYECVSIMDGTAEIEARSLFANAKKEHLEQAFREHNVQQERVVTPIICMMVNTGRHQVLIDTGCGTGALPMSGKLLQNLRAEGMEAKEVDMVVLTHGHWDHLGGNTDEEGQATFSQARYVMWKDEWNFVTSETTLGGMEEGGATFIRQNLVSIQDRFELMEQEKEILPGIGVVAAPGHTVGHIAVAVLSGNEEMLCLGDAAIHPIHVEHPEWHTGFDDVPQQAIRARGRLLERAAEEGALIFAPHFPFPGVGHVIKGGGGWQWQPIEGAS